MNPALQGYLAAVGETLAGRDGLAAAGAELGEVARLVESSGPLTSVVDDAAVPRSVRRAVLDDLLGGKVGPEVLRLVDRAVTVLPASETIAGLYWLARQVDEAATRSGDIAPEDTEPVLGRMASRQRVNGYAAAVFEESSVGEIEEMEDQLFRFARTVEASRPLRRALGDRDLPVRLRQQVVAELLGTGTLEQTRRIAAYAVRGGRARDIVATLDALVEAAAAARGWRVARVRSASEVDGGRRDELADALSRLAGGPVELQVTVDPSLIGGVVVQVGDLLVDGSTRHRLDQLKDHLLVPETGNRLTHRLTEGKGAN